MLYLDKRIKRKSNMGTVKATLVGVSNYKSRR